MERPLPNQVHLKQSYQKSNSSAYNFTDDSDSCDAPAATLSEVINTIEDQYIMTPISRRDARRDDAKVFTLKPIHANIEGQEDPVKLRD